MYFDPILYIYINYEYFLYVIPYVTYLKGITFKFPYKLSLYIEIPAVIAMVLWFKT